MAWEFLEPKRKEGRLFVLANDELFVVGEDCIQKEETARMGNLLL